MASLSLPRVLQLKKNSLDAEREQFEKFQTLAIQKAINSIETPVKEKHVRSTIIGTFQEQSAVTYWMVAVRLPLQDNRIVSWKFCHVTHKLLREGHPACLDDSQRHISMIENLGKLWVHLREGYGRLIHLYSNLLVTKLKFHARNPRFPGNMLLTVDELDSIAENDVNNYFQLCVELFDYMEDILNLQAAVFDSLGNARANSMTASGQCRLAALIPCAQDSSHIYDCNVRLLFRLHASLPPDVLAGHRERFRQQFKKLSSFYKHASSLQYYRNLLTLPVLPSNPPNFLLQSDFGTYVTPVVSIPEPPPDEVDAVGSLIDTSDTISQSTTSPEHTDTIDTRATPSPVPDPIVERDRLIEHLQNELRRMRSEVSQIIQERNTMLGSMREHCTRMESRLQATRNELEEEKQKVEIISAEAPEIKKKLTETEDKAKVLDEKFQKLKGAYTQLREEHIALIRQKAEVDKVTSSLRAAAAQHESAKAMLQQQLNDRMKDVELLQQSASSSEEIEAYKTELTNLRSELEHSRQKEVELESLRASMEALEIEYKTAQTEQQEKFTTLTNDLKEATENVEKLKQEVNVKNSELAKVKEEVVVLRQKNGDEFKKIVEEKDSALRQLTEMKLQFQQEKEDLIRNTNNLQADLETFQAKLIDAQNNFESQLSKLEKQLSSKSEEFEDVLNKKDNEIKDALEKFLLLQKEIEIVKCNNDKDIENQVAEIENLQKNITDLNNNKQHSENIIVKLENEITKLRQELHDEHEKRTKYEVIITEHKTEVSNLKSKINVLLETDMNKEQLLKELENSKDVQIKEQNVQINELHETVNSKDKLIIDLKLKNEDLSVTFEKQKVEFEKYKIENAAVIETLKTKLQNVISSKDELIEDLKNMILEKDNYIITLNADLVQSTNDISKISDELKICTENCKSIENELNKNKDQYESTLTQKCNEIQNLNDIINKTYNEKIQLTSVQDKLLLELEVFKNEYTNKEIQKNCEMKELMDKLQNNENILLEKDEVLASLEKLTEDIKAQLMMLEKENLQQKDEIERILSEKEKDLQLTEARLEHAESERLNAECELQDLLQQNTILEADMASLKIQLEEANALIKKQTSRLVACASETALEMTSGALTAFEHSNAQDSNKLAAELASKALEELGRKTEIYGNEEFVARCSLFAAHNAAQLSAYVADLANISTDMELSEKLTNECRSMLTSTKRCVESIKAGTLDRAACVEARAGVAGVARAAVAADRLASGARCVDDELADMDRAIADAATQIEGMLAASRAGDSGVKLEVNEKILDACTTLMRAVKVLVQDSRKLQNELGDPKTRQKMYRRNPQWSEGLISASKAVVFAAKLLVSSADEAVGAAGRVEGVSAAAHEVAGSTAQLVAASRAKAPPSAPALASLTAASRAVAAATGAVVAAVRGASALVRDQETLDTSALSLTATRRLEMESKVRALELESALDAERARLAALRKRHYHLAQEHENGNMKNGEE